MIHGSIPGTVIVRIGFCKHAITYEDTDSETMNTAHETWTPMAAVLVHTATLRKLESNIRTVLQLMLENPGNKAVMFHHPACGRPSLSASWKNFQMEDAEL